MTSPSTAPDASPGLPPRDSGFYPERLAQRFLEIADFGVSVADPARPDCPLVFVNRAFCDIFGYDAHEAVGRNCRFLQGKARDELDGQRAMLRRSIAERFDVTVVVRNFRRGGEPIWVEVSLRHVREPDGRTWVVGFQKDVTARENAIRTASVEMPAFDATGADRLYVDPETLAITYASPAAAELYGVRSSAYLVGRCLLDFVVQSRHDRTRAVLRRVASTESEPVRLSLQGRTSQKRNEVWARPMSLGSASGRTLLLSSNRHVAETFDGDREEHERRVLELVATGADLDEALAAACKALEKAIPGSAASILLVDPRGGTLRAGIAPSLPRGLMRLLDGLEIAEGKGSCGTAAARGAPVIVVDIASDPLWRELAPVATSYGYRAAWSTPLFGEHRELLGTLAVYLRQPHSPASHEQEVILTLARVAEVAIVHARTRRMLAATVAVDAATGLPNRLGLRSHVARTYGEATIASPIAVLAIEVCEYHNALHELGERRLEEALAIQARRIAQTLPLHAHVARRTESQFIATVEYQFSCEELEALAASLCTDLQAPVTLRGEEVALGVCIGASRAPASRTTFAAALQHAEAAVDIALRAGTGQVKVHQDTVARVAPGRLSLEAALRRALEREEFVLKFQPRFRVSDRRIVAVEALVRWRHPERGLLGPDEFIGQAERSGLIVPLGDWVLEEACRQAAAWQIPGKTPIVLGVNVSARQFTERFFAQRLPDIAARANFPLDRLELEITESALMDRDLDGAFGALAALRSRGARVTLDDFGTGYSSLSYLRRIPLDGIKIDRSFVQDLGSSPTTDAIAAAIVTLARTLRLGVVAEGVETGEQLEAVRRLGCNEVQGFLLARPLGAASLAVLLGRSLL